MSRSPQTVDLTRRAYQATSRALGATIQNMAVQDWATLAFHTYMTLRVAVAPDSAEAAFAGRLSLLLLVATFSTVLLVRGEILREGKVRSILYRAGVFAPMVLSYFELRWLLPSLQPKLLDMQLLAIDELLIGTTPSVWMAQFNVRPIVEWFSFFYYSYFWILGAVLLPTLFFDRGRRMKECLIGAMVVCGLGHIGYTFVPGMGPWATLHFEEVIDGGFWWGLVRVAVDGVGAQLDIFPSLHTAYPSYFALHAFAHRDRAPYKYVWPIIAFFALNIIIATMFLRWHWGIDVVFGLLLAASARSLAILVGRREEERDETGDRQLVWEPIWGYQRRAVEARRDAD